jgi:hypothetical protein
LNDKNLQERMENTRRANDEAVKDQTAVLGQVRDTLNEHTRGLQAQGTVVTRLAERMYEQSLNIGAVKLTVVLGNTSSH